MTQLFARQKGLRLRLRKRLTAWLQVRTQQRRTIQPNLPTLQSHATQPSPASRLNRGEQSSRTRRLCRATQRNPAQPANSAEPHNATQPRQLSSQIHGTKQHVKADTSLRKSGRAGPKKQPNLWACALLARRTCHTHVCLRYTLPDGATTGAAGALSAPPEPTTIQISRLPGAHPMRPPRFR